MDQRHEPICDPVRFAFSGVNAMSATRKGSAALASRGSSRRRPLWLGAHLRRQAPRLKARRCAASGLDCSVRPSTLAAMPLTPRSRSNQNGNPPSQKSLTQIFGHSRLLRYQTICFQSTEADATGRLGIAEVAAALIAYNSGPRVLCQQFGTAMATAQDPGQQRTAAPNRSTHDISFRIRIVGKQCLIVLVHRPANVAVVVIGNKHRPLFTLMLAPHDALATLFKSHRRSAPAISVHAGINRVLQQAQQ